MNRMRVTRVADSDEKTIAQRWLDSLGSALADCDEEAVATLFHADCYWRDVVGLTWDLNNFQGVTEVASELAARAQTRQPKAFEVSAANTPPAWTQRAGREVLEAVFDFESALVHGKGVVRLTRSGSDPGDVRAWALMTSGQELKGFEEAVGDRRIERVRLDRPGENWLDKLTREQAYDDKDPEVVIVGGGHSGLFLAARLQNAGVDTLIIERNERIGDNWRSRYHSLTLHNELCTIYFPYMSYPETWPVYLPKDKYAGWLEYFAEAMELRTWTGTTFDGATYDEETGLWSAIVRRADGTERRLRPRHIVLATGGVSGRPNIPLLPGINDFAGPVIHSSRFGGGRDFAGKRVLVLGTGTSSHDVALDLTVNGGADVTMVQRNPTTVVNLDPANMVYGLYKEPRSTEEVDLIALTNDRSRLVSTYQSLNVRLREMDKDLIEGLEQVGFKTSEGTSGGGYLLDYFERGGGYYINVGASEYLLDGRIKVMQAAEIDTYVAEGARLTSGDIIEADVIVLGTGYHNQTVEVADFFGQEVAERVGPIWGWGEDGEIRNAWRRTAQPGLWFMLGGIPQSRNYSRYLAMQIKADLEGLVDPEELPLRVQRRS